MDTSENEGTRPHCGAHPASRTQPSGQPRAGRPWADLRGAISRCDLSMPPSMCLPQRGTTPQPHGPSRLRLDSRTPRCTSHSSPTTTSYVTSKARHDDIHRTLLAVDDPVARCPAVWELITRPFAHSYSRGHRADSQLAGRPFTRAFLREVRPAFREQFSCVSSTS